MSVRKKQKQCLVVSYFLRCNVDYTSESLRQVLFMHGKLKKVAEEMGCVGFERLVYDVACQYYKYIQGRLHWEDVGDHLRDISKMSMCCDAFHWPNHIDCEEFNPKGGKFPWYGSIEGESINGSRCESVNSWYSGGARLLLTGLVRIACFCCRGWRSLNSYLDICLSMLSDS